MREPWDDKAGCFLRMMWPLLWMWFSPAPFIYIYLPNNEEVWLLRAVEGAEDAGFNIQAGPVPRTANETIR